MVGGIIIINMATSRHSRRRKATLVGLSIMLLSISLAPASASSANISHSYQSKGPVLAGSIVSLDASRSNYVEAANSENATRILGIAVHSEDSLLAVDATSGTIQVATSGTATALVSDLNGSIKVGDQISVSPFDGIGMKSEPGSKIVGLAQSSFSSSTGGAQQETIKDKSGATKRLAVGSLQLNISPGAASGGGEAKVNSLQKVVKSLTGKIIPTGRIVVALVITIVTLISLVALIYGSVYSTIISVGRNPLAKYAIYRSMLTVLVMSLLTAAVAMVVVILLLR